MAERKPNQRSDFGRRPGKRPVTECDQYRQERREQWRDLGQQLVPQLLLVARDALRCFPVLQRLEPYFRAM